MQDFVNLFTQLDQTTKTTKKVAALKQYFDEAEEADKVWTIALLSHRRPKRSIRTNQLREWAAEAAGIPLWIFEDSYHVVGDLAETMALVVSNSESKSKRSLSDWINYVKSIKELEDDEKKQKILDAWNQLDQTERFVFNKLITGGWRMGVSQKLMTRALAQHADMDENQLAHRLMGDWDPNTVSFHELVIEDHPEDRLSQPYPFYLAYPIEDEVEELGDPGDWLIERKWDGIRGQVIQREGQLYVWSRGEELLTEKFPEFDIFTELLPDGTVLDGEITAFENDQPLPFNKLQTRIGRKTLSKKILENAPVALIAYDLLEFEGKDLRKVSMQERRKQLEKLVKKIDHPTLQLSESLEFKSWDKYREIREDSRAHFAEGLMLKRKESEYKVGRKKGDWWKWKVDPLTIDAVMIYAMRGHGRRANLYTDYTFAVWNGDELVPFTKAYSGLTDAEIRKVDAFVKKNTVDRFGPVRSVKPELVFEIAFEGIAKSSRHKSGISLRFPRMNRWRHDKAVKEANTLDDLHGLLELYG
jgi:DNA ligase-1